MSDPEQPVTPASTPPDGHTPGRPVERLDRGVKGGAWITKLVVVLILIGIAFLAYQAAAAFFPRWWAQRIGDQVDGRFTAGVLWGLFYGFVFTLVPLLLLAQVRRRFLSWTWRGVVAVVAVVLAAPNWLTLAIVMSWSNAAIAGDSIMDNDAPGFRWATLWGAIAAAAVVLLITATSVRLAQRKKQVRRLQGERDELKAAREHDDEQPARDES